MPASEITEAYLRRSSRSRLVLAAPSGVGAAGLRTPTRRALEAQKEALFQQMLRNPANLDVTFAYADVSARLGDYEAAVSALERMLLFNPNLPRVQLELGALYFRMGSYDLARDYFEKAAAANPPPEVRARIDEYLAQIDKASIAPSPFRLYFSRRPIPDRRQCRARLAADPVADRPGAAQQPVRQAAIGQHLRQRVVAVQL